MWWTLANPFNSDEVLSFKGLYLMMVGSDENAVFQEGDGNGKSIKDVFHRSFPKLGFFLCKLLPLGGEISRN